MTLPSFLQLVRWKNLCLLAYTQYLIKYFLLEPFSNSPGLNNFHFFLLVFTTVLIAAAGYIINDIFDVEADLINKPSKVLVGTNISRKKAFIFYLGLNSIAILLAIYLADNVQNILLSFLFLFYILLLYLYSRKLKALFLIGNITVALLISTSVLLVALFEYLSYSTTPITIQQEVALKIVAAYALFAFLMNFLRELLKDIEDIAGDHKLKMNTLPIVLGRVRAKNIIAVTGLITTILVCYVALTFLDHILLAFTYVILLVIMPLGYISFKIRAVKIQRDIHRLSTYLKITMFTGVNSIIIIFLYL